MCKKERGKVGFMPSKLDNLSNILNVLFSDHFIPGFHKVIGYIIAAVVSLLCVHRDLILHWQESSQRLQTDVHYLEVL
jgi:hypothetical protein